MTFYSLWSSDFVRKTVELALAHFCTTTITCSDRFCVLMYFDFPAWYDYRVMLRSVLSRTMKKVVDCWLGKIGEYGRKRQNGQNFR